MSRRSRVIALLLAVVPALAFVPALTALAQSAPSAIATTRDSACGYAECALGIAPTWNGLAVVRGAAGPRVANLYFLWPRDVTAALRGDPRAPGADSAAASARRAVSLRRTGAALTDIGLVASGVALVSGLRARRARSEERVVGGIGLAALLVSVPVQFAADGALSRAVWWHNLRYAR